MQTHWWLIGEVGPGICAFNNFPIWLSVNFSFSLWVFGKTSVARTLNINTIFQSLNWWSIWLLLLPLRNIQELEIKHWTWYWKHPNPHQTFLVHRQGPRLTPRSYNLLRLLTKTLSHPEVWACLSDGQERGKNLLMSINKEVLERSYVSRK